MGKLKEQAHEAEKQLICKVLKSNLGNMSRSAKELGIDRKTLYNKMSLYKITREQVLA